MTHTDIPALSDALHVLGRAFSHPVDSEDVEDVFRDLRDFPLGVVTTALDTLRKTSRFWPRPHALIDACREAQAAMTQRVALPPDWQAREPGDKWCPECQDTGWLTRTCPGDQTCLRPKAHYAHAFVVPCGCRRHNPVYQHEHPLGGPGTGTAT